MQPPLAKFTIGYSSTFKAGLCGLCRRAWHQRCEYCMQVHVKLGHRHCERALPTRRRVSALHKPASGPTSVQREQLLQQIRCATRPPILQGMMNYRHRCFVYMLPEHVPYSLVKKKGVAYAHACGFTPPCAVDCCAALCGTVVLPPLCTQPPCSEPVCQACMVEQGFAGLCQAAADRAMYNAGRAKAASASGCGGPSSSHLQLSRDYQWS